MRQTARQYNVSTSTHIFANGLSVSNIDTPKPENFNLVDPSNHRWITEYAVAEYMPPPLHFLGKKMLIEIPDSYDVRVSRTGICYFCPSIGYFGGDIDVTLVRPRARMAPALEIFSQYFAEAGYTVIGYSDKGNFSLQTIKKCGGLDNCGKLMADAAVRTILDSFTAITKSKSDQMGEVVHTQTNRRTYADFKVFETCLGSESAAVSLIDDFIEKGILCRGCIFQCSHCLNCDWYSVKELSASFECKRCGTGQIYKLQNWKEGPEPKWFYHLDEVVYQFYKSNSHVPVVTLAKLQRDAKVSFLYTPELLLKREPVEGITNSKSGKIEIDICCIVDGQVVIGKSKIDTIERADIDKLKAFVDAQSKYPDQVLFSTFAETWSAYISEAVSQMPKTRILYGPDLLG